MRRLRTGWTGRIGSAGRVALAAGRAAASRVAGDREADRLVGERLAGELDQLKGMAMKVGQILSYMDVLPEGSAAALSRLQEGGEPLELETIDAVVRDALGRGVHEAFDAFDPVPVAAASIGQVHRARVDGRDVAVKVQYPGIREVLEGDLRTLGRIARVASLGASVDGQAWARELGARLREECDYTREARMQRAFRAAWSADPTVRIPDVVDSHSASTVLTTSWEEGASFAQTVDADPDARARAAVGLVRFAWGSLFGHGAIHADPHPGNSRFAATHVVFLDFGCVRTFTVEEVEGVRALTGAVLDGDRAAFGPAVLQSGTTTRPDRFDMDRHWAWMRELHRPFWDPSARPTRPWLARLAEETGPTNPNNRWIAWPPHWLWILRLQWGLSAVLTRLGADVDLATPFRDALDRPLTPLEA